jgi:Icc-related predicted phosphoesterase
MASIQMESSSVRIPPRETQQPPPASAPSATAPVEQKGPTRRLRIGAIGDTHYGPQSAGALQNYFSEVRRHADILLLCGDLTDHGTPEEAKILAADLANVRLPMVGVLGNHDFESGKQDEVTAILRQAGVDILDGEAVMVHDVGFAGVKGFGGGFDKHMLQPWGEVGIKDFVRGAVDEALKLDSALAKIRTPHRVVLMHYAPVRGTVEGEPLEIYPFLGSSRLEEPLNRYHASMVVHGHVHRGYPEGTTSAGVPVFNVALPLMRRVMADGFPLKVFELDVEENRVGAAAR